MELEKRGSNKAWDSVSFSDYLLLGIGVTIQSNLNINDSIQKTMSVPRLKSESFSLYMWLSASNTVCISCLAPISMSATLPNTPLKNI